MTNDMNPLLKTAVALLEKGDVADAYQSLQAILNESREANDAASEATALHLLGVAAHQQGRLEEARMLLVSSLSQKQRLGV